MVPGGFGATLTVTDPDSYMEGTEMAISAAECTAPPGTCPAASAASSASSAGAFAVGGRGCPGVAAGVGRRLGKGKGYSDTAVGHSDVELDELASVRAEFMARALAQRRKA